MFGLLDKRQRGAIVWHDHRNNVQRHIVISEGEIYHVYNRGVEKRRIFLTDADCERFLRLLYIANSDTPFKYSYTKNTLLKDIKRGKPLVAIGAYALMPNHFHLLVKEIRAGGISSFMEKLTTGYSAYFNKRNDRVGSLFQGTYKAQHAATDEYLKYLFAYIHLNPVKLVDPHWREQGIANRKRTQKFLEKYRFSSYADYVGVERQENRILTRQAFPKYFLDSPEFENFIGDWLEYRDYATVV